MRADELQRRDDERRESARAKQDPNDDDMTRIRKTLEQMPMDEMVELINNPEVMVTRRGISSRRPSGRDIIRSSGQFAMQGFDLPVKKPRKKNKKHCKNLSMCLRQANAEMRTKSGKLRKGKTQSDIMRRAQKLLRKCWLDSRTNASNPSEDSQRDSIIEKGLEEVVPLA